MGETFIKIEFPQSLFIFLSAVCLVCQVFAWVGLWLVVKRWCGTLLLQQGVPPSHAPHTVTHFQILAFLFWPR